MHAPLLCSLTDWSIHWSTFKHIDEVKNEIVVVSNLYKFTPFRFLPTQVSEKVCIIDNEY